MLALAVALALAQGERPVTSPAALLDAGVELVQRGQFPQAAERLVQALALDPNLTEAHYLLGLIRQEGGRRDAALASFRRAAQLDPRHAPSNARLCELETYFAIARESGYEQALAVCRRALQLAPGDAEPHFHLGQNLAKRGDTAAAITAFQTARRLNAKLPGVAFELALANLDTQNLVAAIPLLKHVVATEPAHANARFQLGAALAKQGDCAGAMPHLELAPPSVQKHFVLAGCYTRLQRPAEALRERERAKELSAGAGATMQARFLAAGAQKKAAAGQVEEAIAGYRAALALTPADLTLKIDLAVALLKHGDRAAVRDLLQNESDPLARYQLALAAAAPEARTILESVLGEKPGFVEAWYQLGVTLLALDQALEAERAFAQGVALRADEPSLRAAWAEALERCGRRQEAAVQRRLAGAGPR